MANNSDIIKIGFDYRASLAQFEKETNGVFDGISEKAGKQKIVIQLDAKNDKVIEKIKELQKLKLDKFTFEFGDSGIKEQLKTFGQLENKINDIINLSKGLSSVVVKTNFGTKNKTEAYNQLKQMADVFKNFYGNEEAMHTKAGTEAAHAYYKAYEEALRKGVAESKLQKVTVDVDPSDSFFTADRISSTRIREFANFEKYGGEATALSEEISYFEKRLLKFSDAYSKIKMNLGEALITPEIIQNIEEYVRNLEIAEARTKDADSMGFTKEDIDLYKESADMYLGFATEDAIKENEKYISSLKEVKEEKEQVNEVISKSSPTASINDSKFEELKSDITEVRQELDGVKEKISGIDSEGFESIKSDVERTTESVKELNSELTELKSKVSNNSTGNKSNISSDTQIKDVFQGDAEKSGMDNIASATEEAVQAKKDFATANEGVQSSVDGSKSKLELEAELMSQIAKSAREAADAKKEFVKANTEVKASAESSNNETKKYNTEENANAWKELSYSIQRYSEVSKRISSGKALDGDVEEAERLENKISQLQKLDVLSPTQIEKSEQMLVKLYDKLDDIEKKSKKASLESMQSEIDSYNNKVPEKPVAKNSEFKAAIDNYKNAIKEAQTYLDNLGNTPITEEQTEQWKTLTNNIEKAKKEMDAFSAAERGSDALSRGKEIDTISKYLNKFTGISKQAKQELKGLLDQLQSGDPSVNVKKIHERFLELTAAERAAGRETKSFLDIFNSKVLHRFASQLAMYYLSFYDFIRYARNAINAVKELDTALIDLKKTTTMSDSELERFYYDSNDVAKKLGVTTAEIINQASAWSRLGYSTKEASTQMAELSAKFASISPDMDLDTATDGLVSSMKAFDIEVSNVERDIMDNINRIGNTAATSNGEIVDMLTRSSAAMSAANNTIQETIALETAAVEITRNAETTGTAFKTISMRLRGYDEETEELSDDLKNISGDIADLTKTASTPGGISLFTDETKETYKSTYQILKEISDIYDELSDKNRAELLEKLAGKRGGQVVAGLLSNFDAAEKAIKEMEGAAGSADAEMGIIQESIDYKLNALKETWVGTAQDMLDRGDFGKIIDVLTKLSDVIGFVIDKAGMLGTIGIGAGLFAGIKNVGRQNYISKLQNCYCF